ncbi:MAG: hypothetical protein WBZ36_05495 [Candidatus Nitrosopolaris sp.]
MNLQNDKYKEQIEKTAIVTIAAIATVLAVSTIAMGSVHNAFANKTITMRVNNTGVNVPTHTNQKQECQTVGGTSGITNSCQTTSTDTVTQSGGMLQK